MTLTHKLLLAASALVQPVRGRTRGWPAPVVLGALLICLTAVLASFLTYRSHRGKDGTLLEAAATHRADQIADWLDARLNQARFAADSAAGVSLARWLDTGDAGSAAQVVKRLASLRNASRAGSALVVDLQGMALMTDQGVPDRLHSQPAPALQQAVLRAMAGSVAVLTEPYAMDSPTGQTVIDFVAPITAPGVGARSLVVMRMDTSQALGRMLHEWPLPSHALSARLVDTAGRTVLPLGPAQAGGALTPAGAGAVDTHDAKGHAVLAVTRHVPGTPWHLVVQIPGIEIQAHAWTEISWILGLTALALVTLMVAVRLAHNHAALRLKQALADRQASELDQLRTLKAVAEASTDAIYAKDLQGRYLLFNRAASQVTSVQEAQVIGQDDRVLFPPEQARRIMAMDRQVMDEGVFLNYDEELDSTQGRMTYQGTKGPLRGPDGQVVGMFGISRDITARRRAEMALRDAAELVRAVADSVLDRIVVLDAQGQVLAINSAWQRMDCGNTSELLRPCRVGDNYLDLIGRADDPQAQLARAAICSVLDGSLAQADLEHTCGDGAQAPQSSFVMKVTPLKASDGGAVVVHSDVSQLKRNAVELQRHRHHLEELVRERTAQIERATEAAARSEQFVRALTDNVPVGLAYWDESGHCRFANVAYCERFGLGQQQVLGMAFTQLLDRPTRNEFRGLIQRVRAGEACEYLRTEHRGGGIQHSRINFLPHRVGGAVQGYFVLTTDVTALRQAQDLAEAANRTKSMFLATMSHEIRTPMNAIIGFTDLLRQDCADQEPAARRLDHIAQAAHHLLQIINDALDLSKIEAGKLTLEHTPFRLQPLLQRTLALVATEAMAKGIALSLECLGTPVAVGGDPTRLSQALLNLLGNAVKFTGQGSVVLRCRVMGPCAGGQMLRFEVTDTGIGVAPDQLPRLFTAFEQGDSSTTRRYGGTGLGLVLTRRLALLMGGDAGADSVPAQGSTFWFTACLQEVSGAGADLDARLGLPAWGAPAPPPVLRDARVLVVEDNGFNQEVLRAILERAGLVVDVAGEGRQALTMAAQVRYDLVLTDLQMPGMDGIEAARGLRALAGYAEVPIVALTANAFSETRDACLAAGMNDYVAKPVSPKHLYGVLLRWLPGAALGPQTGPAPLELPAAAWAPVPPDAAPPAMADNLAPLAGADDELQKIRDELRTLSYCVSHDLRSPLMAVQGFASTLRDTEGTALSPRGRQYLDRVIAASTRMDEMIGAILAWSRADRAAMQVRPVALGRLVQGCAADLGRALPQARITVEDLPDVLGDSALLRQVLEHLLANALKFSAGRPDPQVSVQAQMQGGMVCVSVSDNGVGFDPAYGHKLFGLFQRLHSESEFPGAGVGLALARRVVVRLGGDMTAQSVPGGLTTFSFTLRPAG